MLKGRNLCFWAALLTTISGGHAAAAPVAKKPSARCADLGGQLHAVPNGWLGAKTGLLAQIVRGACDAAGGLVDKVISAPVACIAPATKALQEHRCRSGGMKDRPVSPMLNWR